MKVREFEIARAKAAVTIKPMLSHWRSYADHLSHEKSRLEAQCITTEMELRSAQADIGIMESMLEFSQRKKFEDQEVKIPGKTIRYAKPFLE